MEVTKDVSYLGKDFGQFRKNLIDFTVMGSSLFKSLYPNDNAKVALLNIGSEELKGNEIIKETYQQLNQKNNADFEFKGYIEGNQLMNGDVNVIVADGFTGNIALKTAEGTANFIVCELRKALSGSLIAKISSILNFSNLKFSVKPDLRKTLLSGQLKFLIPALLFKVMLSDLFWVVMLDADAPSRICIIPS